MLPDFPVIKLKLGEAINKYLQNRVRQDPLFSQIRQERHFEGSRMSSAIGGGEFEQTGYKKMQGDVSVKTKDIIEKGPLAFIEEMQKTIEEIQKQMSETLFDKMREITEKTGNIVNARGQEFSFDHFLELLEKMQIDFDEHGNPSMPTLVVSPELGVKLQHKIKEWKANEEYNKKYDNLIARKRKEWNDRESNRKLVD